MQKGMIKLYVHFTENRWWKIAVSIDNDAKQLSIFVYNKISLLNERLGSALI